MTFSYHDRVTMIRALWRSLNILESRIDQYGIDWTSFASETAIEYWSTVRLAQTMSIGMSVIQPRVWSL